MKKILLVCLCVSVAAAADKVTLSGVLMDKACVTAKIDPVKHDKECAQMDDCQKSGYGVITADGKFVPFDAAGNKKAAAWLKTTKTEKNLKVTVTGAMQGETLKVEKIE